MLCRNPYATSDGKAYGCGQCMPCRSNRRRKWQSRILLEAGQYADNAFITLTYDDVSMPKTASGLGTVCPVHLRGFFDRLRYHYGTVGRRPVRFYAVGEYGDETMRPHYHAAVFNVPSCQYGMSIYNKLQLRCCPVCELVRRIWGKGHVFLGTLERDSAGYVASYVTKKMTRSDDPRLIDRYPEFARMSLKPGLGADAMFDVADAMMKYGLDNCVDVPNHLLQSRTSMPLDRYLRRKLRLMVGRDEKAPQEVIDEIAEEVQAVLERAHVATSAPGMKSVFRDVFRAMVMDDGDKDFAQFEHRRKLFNRRRNAL